MVSDQAQEGCANDKQRGKVISKHIRAIQTAVREGGGGDPSANLPLKNALAAAKSDNVPVDNIDRAIERGLGAADGGAVFETVPYEGYGPSGVAILVEALTDNRNRTAGEVRHVFTKRGDNLSGSVAWQFDGVNDNATGTGYIMFSEVDVFTRFSAAPPTNTLNAINSDHLIAVRFNGFTWEYNNDVAWVPFVPDVNDRLIASLNFDFDSISSLQYASGSVNGIEQGWVIGDLVFEANMFNGISNVGEFTVSGNFFAVSSDPAFPVGFRPFPLTTAQGGTVELDSNGDLVYTSAVDYYGPDSFEYFIVDQGFDVDINGVQTPNFKYAGATVLLSVDPVNDAPGALDQSFVTPEDTAITITKADLVAGSVGHATPVLGFPFDESNQNDPNTNVVELNIGGVSVTAANAASAPFATANGVIEAVNFDSNGFLVDLVYRPNPDFNADNPLDNGARRIDSFGFTVADNGVAVLPQGGTGGTPGVASLPLFLFDGDNYLWDIYPDGEIFDGDNDSYDGGMQNTSFFFGPGIVPTEEDGREVVLGPQPAGLLDLVRKVYVPEDDNFARFLEIYTNTNPFPVTQNVTIETDLGSDFNTIVVATASGDQTVAVNDDWIVTDDSFAGFGDPAIGHVIRGTGGSLAPINFTHVNGIVNYTYRLTVNPGETQIVMSYGIQNYDRTAAELQAQELVVPSGAAIRGLTPAELQSIVNFDLSSLVPPQATFQNPPETTTATAFILVTPQNDVPVLGDDLITSSDPVWNSFSGADPTEDTTLIIPAAFLLNNDTNAPASAIDELIGINDSNTLSLVPINFTTTLGGTVTLLPSGDLSYQPPANAFGLDTFEYAARDQGIDEDVFFNRVVNGLESRGTVSILIDPVNDPPRAFDRFLFEVEDTAITFDADDLLDVLPVALPSNASPLPAAPYDENEQTLRVVAFSDADESIDVNSLINLSTGNDGDGTLTMSTVSGGTLTFNFLDGAFVDGSYVPGPNYNQRTPFAAVELFRYVVADNGITTIPDSGLVDGTGIDTVVDLPDRRSQPADVTITISPVNDAPIFDFMPVVDILERDDRAVTVVSGWASNISPGPLTALDELQRETVSFTYVPALSNVPAGLFRVDPQFDPNGALSVFPNPDQIGTAEIVVQVQDVDNVSGSFAPIFSQVTFTLNIRPVNDAPRIDPGVINTGQTLSADQAYSVDSAGVLTLRLKEDNTGPGGAARPFFIPMTNPSGPGYTPPGLLDLFEVGPANEIAPPAEPGGSQYLELFDFPSQTALGGQLVEVRNASGAIVSLAYTPPADYNNSSGVFDSFNYVVIDKSDTGDETYSLIDGQLVPDRLTATNQVLIDLTPVNDRPVFDVSSSELEVAEDSPLQRVGGYAINFAAGPVGTASDENDLLNGQTITFEVTATNVSSPITDFFTVPPTITAAGVLEYQAAPDVFGQFEFDIVLMDDGALDLARGDINASLPRQLTINVRPINDAPVIDPAAIGSLDFSTSEDQSIDLSASAAAVAGDLLGAFNPGPSNESSNITPGGNQTLVIDNATFPSTTDEGGILTPVTDGNGDITHYRYQPRSNFVGMDSFIYTVIDDGTTVGVGSGGQVTPDPQATVVTVTIDVLAVNDAPTFVGADDVTVDEDSGVVTISDWATEIQPGPADADDELAGLTAQDVSFDIELVTGDPAPFTTAPAVTLTTTTSGIVASLSFEPAPNANGVAVFAATLMDDGPTSAANGDQNITVQTFTITVDAINDPPTFDPGADVTVAEDSGAYDEPWATNISPGPADEATTQSIDRFEVVIPPGSEGLFSVAPAVSIDGTLTFTPADDASGTVELEVTAVDSLGGRSATIILPVSITESDDSPVPQDDFIDADEDNVLIIDVVDILANDLDPDLLTNPNETLAVNSVSPLSFRGALVTFNAATGEIEYDPRTSEALQALSNGQLEDRFTYTVVDADGEVAPPMATVFVNVQGLNDAPLVTDDSPFVLINSSAVLDVLANDVDVDGTIDPSSIVITLQPTAGALSVAPDGTLTYVTQPGFEGNDVFRYTVADDLGQQSQQATVTVRVSAAPLAGDDVVGTFLENPIDIDVLGNDLGDLDPATVVVETPPTNGQAIPQADGTIRYTPNDGYLGPDSFQYSVADVDGRRSAPASVDVQVVESNLQNPLNAFDVNASGTVTGLDALLVINKLSQAGGASSIPVDPADRGPDYYDVDGSKTISGLDALLVINQLAIQQDAAEPEWIQAIDPSRQIVSHGDSPVQPVSTIQQITDKVVGSTEIVPQVSADVIDLIVEASDEDESASEAIDAVLSMLG